MCFLNAVGPKDKSRKEKGKFDDIDCKFEVADFYGESPNNIFIIDKLGFKKDSLHNSDEIWRENANWLKVCKKLFGIDSTGLKDIVENNKIQKHFYNDIYIIFNNIDFDHYIAPAADAGRAYDYGESEIKLLEKSLEKKFDHSEVINPLKKNFKVKFFRAEIDSLKGRAAVVLTQHNYIKTEDSEKIADITTNRGHKEEIFEDQNFFKIGGQSEFTNLPVKEIPEKLTIAIINEKTDSGHKFHIEHNPGTTEGTKTEIVINRDSDTPETWVIDYKTEGEKTEYYIYELGRKSETETIITIENCKPSAKKKPHNKNKDSKPKEKDNFHFDVNETRDPYIGTNNLSGDISDDSDSKKQNIQITEKFQLLPRFSREYCNGDKTDFKFSINSNGNVMPHNSGNNKSAEIIVSPNSFKIMPVNNFSSSESSLSHGFSDVFLNNNDKKIKISSEKSPLSLNKANKKYWGSIEYNESKQYTVSGEHSILTAGSDISSDIVTGVYSSAAYEITGIINSIKDIGLQKFIRNIIFTQNTFYIEHILTEIISSLEQRGEDADLIKNFKIFKDDYNKDLSFLSTFSSKEHLFIRKGEILNIGSSPVYVLNEAEDGFEVKEIPGIPKLKKEDKRVLFCSECSEKVKKAYDPAASAEVREEIFDDNFTNCSSCKSARGEENFEKIIHTFNEEDLICAGMKIFSFKA